MGKSLVRAPITTNRVISLIPIAEAALDRHRMTVSATCSDLGQSALHILAGVPTGRSTNRTMPSS